MSRTRALTKALAALLATALLLIGVPVALIAVAGYPLPTTIPSWDLISRHLSDGDVPDEFVIGVFACVVWITWAQLAYALIVEFIAAARGTAARRAPVLPGLQRVAANLATWTTLTLTTLTPVRTAIAAPAPLPAITIDHHPETTHTTTITAPHTAFDVEPDGTVADAATAPGIYETQRGDSWWSLAERLLGSGHRWAELRDLNHGPQPTGDTITATTEDIRPGWHLTAPADANPTLLTTPAEPARLTTDAAFDTGTALDPIVGFDDDAHTVTPGDNLWTVTGDWLRTELDREPTPAEHDRNWRRVVQLNLNALTLGSGNADLIYPDEVIVVPDTIVHADGTTHTTPSTDKDTPAAEPQVTNTAETALDDTTPTERAPVVAAPEVAAPTIAPTTTTPPATTVPATTAAPTTTAVPSTTAAPTATAAPKETATPSSGSSTVALVAAGVTPLLAGIIAWRLGLLRRMQMQRRRPGTDTATAPEHDELADQLRVIGATDAPAWTDATLRTLTHRLRHTGGTCPEIAAMRIRPDGPELLLIQPAALLPPGFEPQTPTGRVIGLTRDIELADLADAAGETPLAPAMVPIGATDEGDLLLNLETHPVLTIDGDADIGAGMVRAIVTGIANASWTADTTLLVADLAIDCGRVATAGRTVAIIDLDTEAEAVIQEATTTAEQDGGASGAARRSASDGHEAWPVIVVVAGDPTHPALPGLSEAARQPGSGLALVIAGEMDGADERIRCAADGTATVEGMGITITAASIPAAIFDGTTALLAAADDHTPVEREPVEPEIANAPAPDTEEAVSTDITRAIAEIMAPRPVEVSVLTDTPTVTGVDSELTARPMEMLAYLAVRMNESVTTEQFETAIWPDGVAGSSVKTARSRLRRDLGTGADGSPRLMSASNTGVLGLSDEVGCDWARVEQLLDLAASQPEPRERMLVLSAALELVGGHPFSAVPAGKYGWLDDVRQVRSVIEVRIVDAADELADMALTAGNAELAAFAADQGLRVVPDQEGLYRRKMAAADLAGNPDAIDAAFRHATRAAQTLDPLDDVQPETQALYDRLTKARRADGASSGS